MPRYLSSTPSLGLFAGGGPLEGAPKAIEKVSVITVEGSFRPTQAEGSVPKTITAVIGVNNTVIWKNKDSVDGFNVDHAVTSEDDLFDSGLFGTGKEWEYTFTSPGAYPYYCVPHPWMKGTVLVREG